MSSSGLRDGARGAGRFGGLEVAVKAHSVILDHACMFIAQRVRVGFFRGSL